VFVYITAQYEGFLDEYECRSMVMESKLVVSLLIVLNLWHCWSLGIMISAATWLFLGPGVKQCVLAPKAPAGQLWAEVGSRSRTPEVRQGIRRPLAGHNRGLQANPWSLRRTGDAFGVLCTSVPLGRDRGSVLPVPARCVYRAGFVRQS
jgi:hypothetical protein